MYVPFMLSQLSNNLAVGGTYFAVLEVGEYTSSRLSV